MAKQLVIWAMSQLHHFPRLRLIAKTMHECTLQNACLAILRTLQDPGNNLALRQSTKGHGVIPMTGKTMGPVDKMLAASAATWMPPQNYPQGPAHHLQASSSTVRTDEEDT